MSSQISFSRWSPRTKFSLPYSSYNAYSGELRRMYITMVSSHKYVYSTLHKDKMAKWEDLPNKYFDFNTGIKKTNAYFLNLKEWSKSYNKLENWVNLNTLISINANLEIYMASIIKLSLESDVGVIYGMPQSIDGIKVIKSGGTFDFSKEIESCVKGMWETRFNNFKKMFKDAPLKLKNSIPVLNKIRKIRNDTAHAFGRDIAEAQNIHKLQKLDSIIIRLDKVIEYWNIVDECVQEIDKLLYRNHVGEYQLLYFYHNMKKEIES